MKFIVEIPDSEVLCLGDEDARIKDAEEEIREAIDRESSFIDITVSAIREGR